MGVLLASEPQGCGGRLGSIMGFTCCWLIFLILFLVQEVFLSGSTPVMSSEGHVLLENGKVVQVGAGLRWLRPSVCGDPPVHLGFTRENLCMPHNCGRRSEAFFSYWRWEMVKRREILCE